MKKKIWVGILFCLVLSADCLAGAPIEIYDTRCEYLHNPKGIDEARPRLGWKLRSSDENKHSQYQTAYRIIVSSRRELLHKNKGDIWDSKWVNARQTQQVVYAGAPLVSDRTYYWKVCIKDEKGRASEWSMLNFFTTGFFSQNEWLASWIGDDQEFIPGKKDCNIRDPWFRKIV